MSKNIVSFFIVLITLTSAIQSLSVERNDNGNGYDEIKPRDSTKLLSRRRRYLKFPEGSSLQLVYDQIIGVVDFTNIHIFGITCSLAWQLPHKTHFTKQHTEVMHNSKISISDVPADKIDYNEKPQTTGHKYHFDTFFNRSNYHSHKIDNGYYAYLKSKPTLSRPPSKSPDQYDDWQRYRTNKLKWNYSHDVYPALRMRRHISDHDENINRTNIHPEVMNSMNHHRDTRFDLYKSIEKYLDAKGENGADCIKLAICETTQIGHLGRDNEPDSFVKELLRVVFSLPSPKFHSTNQRNKYDVVLNDIDSTEDIDCHSKYSGCSTSIWSKNFVF